MTNGDEGEVLGGNVRALGEVVRLDLSLDDLLVTGVLPQKNAMFPPQKGYISFNDINKDDNDDNERVDEVV